MTDAKPSVLVMMPAYGQTMTSHTGGMLYALGQALTATGVKSQFLWFSMCDVVEARNVFLTRWYDEHPEYSHLLMIDADMHASPQLILDMIALNKPLVGVFYRNREQGHHGDINAVLIGHTLPSDKHEMLGGFLKVAHVGAGFLLIRRDVVTQMLKKFPEINDLAEVGKLSRAGVTRIIRAFEKMRDPIGQQLSEDYAFCERWLQCGGEVWANVEHKIDHIGPANFPLRFLDHVQFTTTQDKDACHDDDRRGAGESPQGRRERAPRGNGAGPFAGSGGEAHAVQ